MCKKLGVGEIMQKSGVSCQNLRLGQSKQSLKKKKKLELSERYND